MTDQYLRRPDGSIYGVREKTEYEVADENLTSILGGAVDGAGCRQIDLGPNVYGLVDYDGEYRVGLYYDMDGDQDDGGVCALFSDFESCKSFVERLAAITALKEAPVTAPIQYTDSVRPEFPDFDTVDALGFDGTLRGLDGREPGKPITWEEVDARTQTMAVATYSNPSDCYSCSADLSDVPMDEACPMCGYEAPANQGFDAKLAQRERDGKAFTFEQALARFVHDGHALLTAWYDLDPDLEQAVAEGYPACLPSFDEFTLQLQVWKDTLEGKEVD